MAPTSKSPSYHMMLRVLLLEHEVLLENIRGSVPCSPCGWSHEVKKAQSTDHALRGHTWDIVINLIWSNYAISAWNADEQTWPLFLSSSIKFFECMLHTRSHPFSVYHEVHKFQHHECYWKAILPEMNLTCRNKQTLHITFTWEHCTKQMDCWAVHSMSTPYEHYNPTN